MQRNATDWGKWAAYQRNRLHVKYDAESSAATKRENGMNLYVIHMHALIAIVTDLRRSV